MKRIGLSNNPLIGRNMCNIFGQELNLIQTLYSKWHLQHENMPFFPPSFFAHNHLLSLSKVSLRDNL